MERGGGFHPFLFLHSFRSDRLGHELDASKNLAGTHVGLSIRHGVSALPLGRALHTFRDPPSVTLRGPHAPRLAFRSGLHRSFQRPDPRSKFHDRCRASCSSFYKNAPRHHHAPSRSIAITGRVLVLPHGHAFRIPCDAGPALHGHLFSVPRGPYADGARA